MQETYTPTTEAGKDILPEQRETEQSPALPDVPIIESPPDKISLLEDAKNISEFGIESAQLFVGRGLEQIAFGDQQVEKLAVSTGLRPEDGERIAEESGIASRWNVLRSKIARVTFSAFMALQAGSAEQGAMITNAGGEGVELAATQEKRPASMEQLAEAIHGGKMPPEIVTKYRDIRDWQRNDPSEHSAMIFQTTTGYELAHDEKGDETSVSANTAERDERSASQDVVRVTDIHTHPLKNYSEYYVVAENTLERRRHGEKIADEAVRIAERLASTPKTEYVRQEKMMREGILDAFIDWPSTHDIWRTFGNQDELAERGKATQSMVADGSGLWEISVRDNTPFGDAVKLLKNESQQERRKLKQVTAEFTAHNISSEEYLQQTDLILKEGSSKQYINETLLQYLSRCGWEVGAPYSKEAADSAEQGDTTLAREEYAKRLKLVEYCIGKLSEQGLDLIHHPWPSGD